MCNNEGHQSSANMVAKGGCNGGSPSRGRGGGHNGGGRGGHGGFGHGGGGRGQGSSFQQGVFCQLCGKEGHAVVRCFKRFDASVSGPPQKSAAAATNSYGVDTNWHMDSGATDHITGELERLTVRDKYSGGDQVHATNGSGMEIEHIGDSVLHSPTGKIHLKNILHVPKARKSLVSVNHLARDNKCFLEFHPNHFCIKEHQTKKTLLSGRCEGGLYPLKSSNKQVLGVDKPSRSLWHSRLGHASAQVVQQVISHHKLSFLRESNNHVCDACQQGKFHQLPYERSSSVSSSPLDLVFFMCGGQHLLL